MNTICETIRNMDEILAELRQLFSSWDRDLIGEELIPF